MAMFASCGSIGDEAIVNHDGARSVSVRLTALFFDGREVEYLLNRMLLVVRTCNLVMKNVKAKSLCPEY